MSKPKPPAPWFINDRAIEDPSLDAFGHQDLARQLAEIVRTVDAPATIGLIGGFGTGKSSIGNLLRAELRTDKDYCVVALSAEKHTGVARQRALLYSFAEAVQEDAGVNGSVVQKLLSNVEVDEDLELPALGDIPLLSFLKENGRVLGRAAGIGVVFAFLAYLVLVVGAFVARVLGLTQVNPITWPLQSAAFLVPVVTFLIAAAAPAFAAWLRVAVTPGTARWSRPRAEAADELERVFGLLAAEVKAQLVVIVDDVDRLPKEEVLEALNAIKTFQAVPKNHPPIFVIACDDQIVVQAINKAKDRPAEVPTDDTAAAEEYLSKLFSVRQPLPPHLKEDMGEYAENLLRTLNHAGVDALGPCLREVLQILMHDGVIAPRHVIHLINAYFIDYRLARTREVEGGRLGRGEVTGNPLLLARLTVLKLDFRTLYDLVRQDFELLHSLDLKLTGGLLDEEQERLVGLAGELDSSVEDFLRSTAPYAPSNVPLAPFFYLGQTVDGRELGSTRADQIRSALLLNDSVRFRELMTESPSAHAVGHALDVLAKARAGIPRENAVRVAAGGLDAAPETERRRLADGLANILNREPRLAPGPKDLSKVVSFADPSYTDGLIAMVTDFGDEESAARRDRARALLALAETRPENSVLMSALASYFDDLPADSGWTAAPEWLEAVASLPDITRARIVGTWFYVAMCDLAVGAATGEVSAEDRARLANLIAASAHDIQGDSSLVEAVKRCLLAAGEEPRLVGVQVIGGLRASTATVQTLVPAAVAAVAPWLAADEEEDSEAVEVDIPTVVRTIEVLSTWASSEPSSFAKVADYVIADLDAAVAAVSAADGAADEVVSGWLATLVPALGRPLPASTSAVIATLAPRLDPADTVGLAMRDDLVTVLAHDDTTAAEIADGLTAGIRLSHLPTEPSARFAVEALPKLNANAAGHAQLARLVEVWRRQLSAATPDPAFYRTPIAAIAALSQLRELPPPVQESTLTRLAEMVGQGGPHATAAAAGLASIIWDSSLRSQAATHLASLWPALEDGDRDDVVRGIAGWEPSGEELTGQLGALVADRFADSATGPQLSSTVGRLWNALPPASLPRVAPNMVVHAAAVRRAIAAFDADAMAATLREAQDSNFDAVVGAAHEAPEEVRGSAASSFIEEAFDDAALRWEPEQVRAVVVQLATHESAAEDVPRLIERVHSGQTEAFRAATILGYVFQTFGADLRQPFEADLIAAVVAVLIDADPNVARALGSCTRGLADRHFSDALQAMRKTGDQQPKEAANAFQAVRS